MRTIVFVLPFMVVSCFSKDNSDSKKIHRASASSIGRGFDTRSGELKSNCLKNKQFGVLDQAKNGEFLLTRVETFTDLRNSLNLPHFSLARDYNPEDLFGCKSMFLKSAEINSYSQFFLFSHVRINRELSAYSAELKDKYLEYLSYKGAEDFFKRCGDQFVSRSYLGVETHVLFEIGKSKQSFIDHLKTYLSLSKDGRLSNVQAEKAIEQLLRLSVLNIWWLRPDGSFKKESAEEISKAAVTKSLFENNGPQSDTELSVQVRHYDQIKTEKEPYRRVLKKLQKAHFLVRQAINDTSHANYPNNDSKDASEFIDQLEHFVYKIGKAYLSCKHNDVKCSKKLMKLSRSVKVASRLKDHFNQFECFKDNNLEDVFVGIENTNRFILKKSRFCPGYEPPLGPVSIHLPNPLVPEDLSSVCQSRLGHGWILSEQGKRSEDASVISCIKLAKMTMCRHPSHGREGSFSD